MSGDGEVSVRFTSDEAALLRAVNRLVSAHVRQTAELGATSQAAGRADQDLRRFAERTKQLSATPIERYHGAVDRLRQAYRAGMLAEGDFRTAVDRERATLDRVQNKLSESDEELKRFIDRHRELSTTPLDRYNAAVERLREGHAKGMHSTDQMNAAIARERATLDQATTAAGRTGGAMRDTFVGKVGGYLSGIASVTAAVAAMKEVLSHAAAEADKASGSIDKLSDPRKRLAQVARSPEDLQQMISDADMYAEKHGVERKKAYEVMFSARSESFDQKSVLDKVFESSAILPDLKAAGTMAGQIKGLFPKSDMTREQSLNMALVASNDSRIDYEEMAKSMPRAAEGAALAGASPEETMAVLGVLSMETASAETAADRIKGFGSKSLITPELKGRGIIGAFDALKKMDAKRREKILGENQELNTVYAWLEKDYTAVVEQKAKIEQARVDTGTENDATTKQARFAMTPTTEVGRQNQADLERRRAEIRREIANEDNERGAAAARNKAAVDRAATAAKEQNVGIVGEYGAEKAAEAARSAGVGAAGIRTAGEVGSRSGRAAKAGAIAGLLNPFTAIPTAIGVAAQPLLNRRQTPAETPAPTASAQPDPSAAKPLADYGVTSEAIAQRPRRITREEGERITQSLPGVEAAIAEATSRTAETAQVSPRPRQESPSAASPVAVTVNPGELQQAARDLSAAAGQIQAAAAGLRRPAASPPTSRTGFAGAARAAAAEAPE